MKKINILVTSGGTFEHIDAVRIITNLSTGSLGSKITEEFLKEGIKRENKNRGENKNKKEIKKIEVGKIFHLTTKTSVKPKIKKGAEKLIVLNDSITSAQSLLEEIKKTTKKNKIDIIIHAAAVSDYKVKSDKNKNKKISSDKEEINITLVKIPKIIKTLRGAAKEAVIVGFKLLSKVSKKKLIRAGEELIKKNRLDFCLANDTKELSKNHHKGFLISKEGKLVEIVGKEEIAKLICKETVKKLER